MVNKFFSEGKVYENAGKQTNRYVSNQLSGESESPIGKRKEPECPFTFERWKTDDRAISNEVSPI